nr:LysR family transcriptional regulator [Acetatifactor sp.]
NQASKDLFISPQGLTKTIQRIEKELSTTLFVRNTQGISPTPEADLFYLRMRPLVDSYCETLLDLQKVNFSHLLRVKLTSGILSYLSLDFLESYQSGHKDVELIIDECPDSLIHDKLLAHECDLAIMSGPIKDERVSTSIFTRIPIVAVVNKKHALASKTALTFKDLEGEKLALISHRSNTYRQFMRRLSAANVCPSAIYEAEQLQYNHQRAQLNNCIGQSFLCEAHNFNFPDTVIVPFEDPSFTWNSYFCWLSDTPLNDIAMEFKTFTYEWLKSRTNSQ